MSARLTKIAQNIAAVNGDNFDGIHQDKPDWIDTRGLAGGRFRDVNEPRRDDYLDMAAAAVEALRITDGSTVAWIFNRILDEILAEAGFKQGTHP